MEKENPPAFVSFDCSLSRGVSTEERMAEDVETPMMLCKSCRQIGSGTQITEGKPKKKKERTRVRH